jgi:hypothetical protein
VQLPTAYLRCDDILAAIVVTACQRDDQTGGEYQSGRHLIMRDLRRIRLFVRAGGFLRMAF